MVSFVVQSLQFEKPGRATLRIAGTLFVLGYVGLLGSFIIQMRWFEGRHEGLVALLFLVSAAKGADTGAYTVGRLAGRHKLWPALSPQKTIEGAIGGLVFAVAASLIVAAISRYALELPVLNWGTAVLFGLIIGVVAQIGDLMESMIKRDCERKDASDAVPGFGGILDVADSLSSPARWRSFSGCAMGRDGAIASKKVKPHVQEQERHDDQLERDLERQRLKVIERFGQGNRRSTRRLRCVRRSRAAGGRGQARRRACDRARRLDRRARCPRGLVKRPLEIR